MTEHQPPPFSIQLLKVESDSPLEEQFPWVLPFLPASYRTESDNLAIASRDVIRCIEKELDLQRLTKVFGWLWLAGRPMPRPLHYQLLLNRDIMVTEQMDMHLVWTTGRIFLKPMPRYLLVPIFWDQYLCCEQACCSSAVVRERAVLECPHKRARQSAIGFLFTYVALIRHESDFLIAKEKHLLPDEIEWTKWRVFVEQLNVEHGIYRVIDPRFIYGELRLSRLNKIYLLSQRPFLRGYMASWHQYGSFFYDSFTWLASATVFIAIVLTAMQVGLATESLGNNDTFQSVSYGFTVFSILGPLIAIGLTLLTFFYMFLDNWIAAVAYKRKRFDAIKREESE